MSSYVPSSQLPAGTSIVVPAAALFEIRSVLTVHVPGQSVPKIRAIKILRKAVEASSGNTMNLRDAKFAIERLMDEMKGELIADDQRPVIHALMAIKNVKVDFGKGDVIIDLEEMQFRVLSSVTALGFEETGRMLDLVKALGAWGRGHKIGVVPADQLKENKEGDNDFEYI